MFRRSASKRSASKRSTSRRSAFSTSSSEVSYHSSLFSGQDGPFPFLPPPRQVQANLERQAAISSSLSMPDHAGDNHGGYPMQYAQDPSSGGIPDYPNPPWMDNANQHGMYHDSGVFGMVRSDCNLPRDGNQFQNVGASPSAACDLPPNNPERSSNEKKKNAGARSKFKAFFDKFAARRHADTKGVVPLNDTGSISGVEPFPDFYSVGRGNPNNACQAASGGENTDARSNASADVVRRYHRASWSSSGRRVPRRSMLSTLKSRISALLTSKNKPITRGRTWEPSSRRSSNPFSPFRRRNAGHTRDSADMFASQPAMTGARML